MLQKLFFVHSILLACLLVVCAFDGKSFTVDNKMDNVRFEKWKIDVSSEDSVLQCSGKCEKQRNCLSFQFSSQNRQCSLFDTIFLFPSAGIPEPGWQYFISSNRRCRAEFIDGRGMDLCFAFIGFQKLNNARTLCGNLQSRIIDIKSDGDNNFLWKIADTLTNETFSANTYYHPFIQGQFDTVDLTWKSDIGTALTYTSWDVNEPLNQNVKQSIKFEAKKWGTSYAYKTRPIICSYRL